MPYDTNSTLVTNTAPYDTQIPFTVYMRVVPYNGAGRRLALIRDMQMTVKFIEEDLLDAGWNIATPVSYKFQKGTETAAIVLQGFMRRDEVGSEPTDVPNQAPTTNVNIISAGTVPGEKTAAVNGNVGGSLSWGQSPTARLDVLASDLKSMLEADSPVIGTTATIDAIRIMGVKYGRGARSFPAPP